MPRYVIRPSGWAPLLFTLLISSLAAAEVPRLASGKPDLSGTYDVATLTPLERPVEFGNKLFMTREEADRIAARVAAVRAAADTASDPNRAAPPAGGDGSDGAAGNVGGYNAFWIDSGNAAMQVDGKFRTSIITDPENGRRPPLTPLGMERAQWILKVLRENTGTAWWVDHDGPGPYDDMEMRPNGERCLLSFGTTSGPPMLPALYNNVKRIVQTQEHVMILAEMIHDARVIRMNTVHLPAEMTFWMGDSIGHWEGDTLVVDTTNFKQRPALYPADEDLHVIERFTRQADGNLRYEFTVNNPTIWTASWSGEYTWPTTPHKVYEYACHEGNYALGNIMRGARLLEREAAEL